MGTAITNDKIESLAFSNLFEVLDNRSNINDPRHTGNTNNKIRQFIYDYDPFEHSADFSLFPYIILSMPNPEYSEISADGKHKKVAWSTTITIRTVRSGAGNSSTDIGRTDFLNICDDVNQTMNSETVKQSLRSLNMHDLRCRKTNSDYLVVDNKPVYEANYEIEFYTRLQVSS